MIFRVKKIVIFGNLFLLIFLLSLTIWTISVYGKFEGSLFPNLMFITVTLFISWIFISSLRSKVLLLKDRVEVHTPPILFNASYDEIESLLEDKDLPGRFFIVAKSGKKVPISPLWFENTSQILSLLRENITRSK